MPVEAVELCERHEVYVALFLPIIQHSQRNPSLGTRNMYILASILSEKLVPSRRDTNRTACARILADRSESLAKQPCGDEIVSDRRVHIGWRGCILALGAERALARNMHRHLKSNKATSRSQTESVRPDTFPSSSCSSTSPKRLHFRFRIADPASTACLIISL